MPAALKVKRSPMRLGVTIAATLRLLRRRLLLSKNNALLNIALFSLSAKDIPVA
jgi:hypothetical protein